MSYVTHDSEAMSLTASNYAGMCVSPFVSVGPSRRSSSSRRGGSLTRPSPYELRRSTSLESDAPRHPPHSAFNMSSASTNTTRPLDAAADRPALVRALPGRKLARHKLPKMVRHQARVAIARPPPGPARRDDDEEAAFDRPLQLLATYASGEHEIFSVKSSTNPVLVRIRARCHVEPADVGDLITLLLSKGIADVAHVKVIGYEAIEEPPKRRSRRRRVREESYARAVERLQAGTTEMQWHGLEDHSFQLRRAKLNLLFRIDNPAIGRSNLAPT